MPYLPGSLPGMPRSLAASTIFCGPSSMLLVMSMKAVLMESAVASIMLTVP